MTLQSFVLQPFQGPGEVLPDFAITGEIERQANFLAIVYHVRGDVSNLIIPAKAEVPTRQHDLWKTTCFECFFGPQHHDRYWEVNLSSAGHWNVYRFDRYRAGMQEEMSVAAIPFRIQQSANELQLALDLDLHTQVPQEQPLDVAITLVMQSLEGKITYWALTHTGAEADFHRRDSFTIGV